MLFVTCQTKRRIFLWQNKLPNTWRKFFRFIFMWSRIQRFQCSSVTRNGCELLDIPCIFLQKPQYWRNYCHIDRKLKAVGRIYYRHHFPLAGAFQKVWRNGKSPNMRNHVPRTKTFVRYWTCWMCPNILRCKVSTSRFQEVPWNSDCSRRCRKLFDIIREKKVIWINRWIDQPVNKRNVSFGIHRKTFRATQKSSPGGYSRDCAKAKFTIISCFIYW